jgi:hypothetical protein
MERSEALSGGSVHVVNVAFFLICRRVVNLQPGSAESGDSSFSDPFL